MPLNKETEPYLDLCFHVDCHEHNIANLLWRGMNPFVLSQLKVISRADLVL